jgi:phage tail-like protein
MTKQNRSSYLQYLPAIYHQDPYLGRFLLPFEDVLAELQHLLATVDYYFSPSLTDAEFLPWLATWVALVLDEEWNEAKRRRLISQAVNLYRIRGTVQGLQEYLEIYTGLVPDIIESRWPGGMQIGVASQIGGFIDDDGDPIDVDEEGNFINVPLPTRIESMDRQEPERRSYYVVDTVASAEDRPVQDGDIEVDDPLQLYYQVDGVERVEIHADGSVELIFVSGASRRHADATITRRDGLIEDIYTTTVEPNVGDPSLRYLGDTFLIDQQESPYRFIVDVRFPKEAESSVRLDKVREIVDLEKPAHTMYYLKLTPVVSQYVLEPMQVRVRSTIGVDTILG